ncbi:BNR-4 repeat-containing protein [uncultured Chryseobacterium sp.]|uniref:BNR repeat-containing protein n=1 Tax=uncultured Chryseobacterium sp. TaxID=259322 RepID=UPI0025D84A80|nr:BNR-4 repeat-containing protein [uncultured Chryseobacterium sp.]
MNNKNCGILVSLILSLCTGCSAVKNDSGNKISESYVGEGWAKNSVNTVVFRKNALVTDHNSQYIAYYDPQGKVIVGKRNMHSQKWETKETSYSGHAQDAHNTISIMTDAEGYLHIAWNHHDTPLQYARSKAPGSLDFTERLPMTGQNEEKVSYPEFYRFPGGDLIFFYRDGSSGNGNLVLNRYDGKTKKWTRLHENLITGEGKRNAYIQACIDGKGTIHLSWVWRESPDVASNHDLSYACSRDGGKTWQKSTGEKYQLPMTIETAERIVSIPQKSELINQTSMAADAQGNPFIVSYWREPNSLIPQYHLIYKKGNIWEVDNMNFRTQAFSLSGGGTKTIPMARPQLAVSETGRVYLIFRDAERGSRISVAENSFPFTERWFIRDLSEENVGSWEPNIDTELWRTHKYISLFVQETRQVDGEGLSDEKATPVKVLDWKPNEK